jgi:hypothetical protein
VLRRSDSRRFHASPYPVRSSWVIDNAVRDGRAGDGKCLQAIASWASANRGKVVLTAASGVRLPACEQSEPQSARRLGPIRRDITVWRWCRSGSTSALNCFEEPRPDPRPANGSSGARDTHRKTRLHAVPSGQKRRYERAKRCDAAVDPSSNAGGYR